MTEYVIDPRRSFVAWEERLKVETDPIVRDRLENILEHYRSEGHGDIDGILKTLSPKAVYLLFGGSFGGNEAPVDSHDAVRNFYETMLESASVYMEHDIERLVVDRYNAVAAGNVKLAIRGASLVAGGMDVDGGPDDWYLQTTYAVAYFPFDQETGLCLGEHVYEVSSNLDTSKKLLPSEIHEWAHP